MDWMCPPAGTLPLGVMILDPSTGCLRLEQLWELPSVLDIMALHRAPAASCTHHTIPPRSLPSNDPDAAASPSVCDPQLEPERDHQLPNAMTEAELMLVRQGVTVCTLLLQIVQHALFQASLLVPAARLAHGGDLTLRDTLAPLEPCDVTGAHAPPHLPSQARPMGVGSEDGWQTHVSLRGEELLDHMGAVSRARVAPMLPGALIHPALQSLHSKLSFLVQPKGYQAQAGAVASSSVPPEPAIQLLQRESGLMGRLACIALMRTRDMLDPICKPQLHAWLMSSAFACGRCVSGMTWIRQVSTWRALHG